MEFQVPDSFKQGISLTLSSSATSSLIECPNPGIQKIELLTPTLDPIRVRINKTFVPKELGQNEDTRTLGIRILSFSFESMEGMPQRFLARGLAPARPRLPDYLLTSTWYQDKWVEDHFKVRIRIDSATPILQVRGVTPSGNARPTLRVVAFEQTLADLKFDIAGPFTSRIPLNSLIGGHSGEYVTIDFISNFSFNPKKLGQSSDYRDLSWQLHELRLLSN
jgi:hypothetical protein